jgi:AcrR family transcriptional regulator
VSEIEVSRRERKKDETRERIFKVAIKLFRDRGFDRTTIDDITEKADVAKGTFFNYFPRKESVLGYLSEQRLSETEANAPAILASGKPVRDKLLEIYSHAASAYQEDRDLSRVVLSELLHQQFSPVHEIGRRWDELLLRVYSQGQASGELRADVDPLRAIGVLTSTYYGLLFMWANCPDITMDLQPELRERLALVMDGLAARKGAKP